MKENRILLEYGISLILILYLIFKFDIVSSWEHISDYNVISSSDYIPSRWVSDLQDVSSWIYPWPERMGTTLGPTE